MNKNLVGHQLVVSHWRRLIDILEARNGDSAVATILVEEMAIVLNALDAAEQERDAAVKDLDEWKTTVISDMTNQGLERVKERDAARAERDALQAVATAAEGIRHALTLDIVHEEEITRYVQAYDAATAAAARKPR